MSLARRWQWLAGAALVLAALLLVLRPGMERSPWAMLRLFHADVRVENFRHLERVFPTVALPASSQPRPLAQAPAAITAQYFFAGQPRAVDDFLARTTTTGLLVLRDGVIVHEQYRLGANADSRFTSFSLAKSVVAALVGIAVQDGAIRSLDDTVDTYVPAYAGSAWAKVTVRDLLRMASGIAFDERYDAQFSDVQRVFQRAYLLGIPLDETVRDYPAAAGEQPPGTRFHYISVNTQVLANVLRHATGQRLVDYAHDKLWEPLGMEDDALWAVDGDDGTEVAYCCLNTTLRDYAKLGQLYLDQGRQGDRQLLPADWVRESTRRSEPWLAAGIARPDRGYGYHWWVPPAADGEYFANGIWGQSVWVDERTRTVIVKTSADPAFEANMGELIAVMRAIARPGGTLPSLAPTSP